MSRIERLRRRAAAVADVRRFFEARGSLEVETPAIVPCPGVDAHIDGIVVTMHPGGRGGDAVLRGLATSPELAMKRLLCEGTGAIHQIGKAWRDGEIGRFHEPEFTMVEWYRPGVDDVGLMDETEQLVRELAVRHAEGRLRHRGLEVSVDAPFHRVSFEDVFDQVLGIDPVQDDVRRLGRALRAGGVRPPRDASRDEILDLLFGAVVGPKIGLDRPTFVVDWPEDRASLARVRGTERGPRAARFELFACGVELCNGYWELSDPQEHRRRFANENALRRTAGIAESPPDEAFLAAIDAAGGLPDCAGNALGLDRLLMLLMDTDDISDVRAFRVDLR